VKKIKLLIPSNNPFINSLINLLETYFIMRKSQIIALLLLLNFVALVFCVGIVIENFKLKNENLKSTDYNYKKIILKNELLTQYPRNVYPQISEGPTGGARNYCSGN